MDKALEMINKLQEILDELYVKDDNIEAKINFVYKDINELYTRRNELVENKTELKNQKEKKDNILNNLKKWKKQRNIIISIIIIIFETSVFGVASLLTGFESILSFLLFLCL